MELCLSIIADELGLGAEYKNPALGCRALELCRYAFPDGDARLAARTLYLARAGELPEQPEISPGAALICVGALPEQYREAPLPILILPEGEDIFRLSNAVGTVFEKYRAISEALGEALYNGGDLQAMVDIMTPVVRNEITMVDSSYIMVAQSFDEVRLYALSGLPQPEENRLLPMELMNLFKINQRFADLKTAREPFYFEDGIFHRRSICMNAILKRDFSCRVILSETENPLRPYDELLVGYLVGFVKRVYERSDSERTGHGSYNLADVLYMTLADIPIKSAQLAQALAGRGFDRSREFLCICIRPSEGDYYNKTVQYYCRQIVREISGLVAFEFQQEIVCLVSLGHYSGSTDEFSRHIIPFIRDNNFRAGFSEIFGGVTAFKDMYRQADIALTYGTRNAPTIWLHKFSDQAINYILTKSAENISPRALCAPEILALSEYDRKKGGALIQTAEAYFKNNLNAVQTAAALYIHRATLIHRLSRIREISGLDFQDADKNLHCQVSLLLLKLGPEAG